MEKKFFYWSIGLHAAVILILAVDFVWFKKSYTITSEPPPLVLDLSEELDIPKTEIYELKPIEKEDPEAITVVEKVIKRADMSKIFSTLKQFKETEEEREKREKEEAERKRAEEQKKIEQDEQKDKEALEKLIAEQKKRLAERRAQQEQTKRLQQSSINMADQDEISRRLKACWNLDTGKKDIDNVIIEIRVKLSRDGVLISSNLVRESAYRKANMRSIAESALRAVQICAMKEDSPFKLLAEKHPGQYDVWETLLLRFNPIDGGVM